MKIIKLISLLIILVILCIYCVSQPIKYHNDLKFSKTITINNNYNKEYDTVLLVLSNHVFKFDTISIFLIETEIDSGFKSFTTPYIFYHSYLIMIDKNVKYNEIKTILCHEFIHIQQVESDDLILPIGINHDFIYKGDTIPYETKYLDRQWEIDAFNKTDRILTLLNYYY
jgi:hypothetical protein